MLEKKDEFFASISEFEKNAEELRLIAKLGMEQQDEETIIFSQITHSKTNLVQSASLVFDDFEDDGNVESKNLENFESTNNKLSSLVLQFKDLTKNEIEEKQHDLKENHNMIKNSFPIIMIAGIFLSVGLGLKLSNIVTRPIEELSDATRQIAKGKQIQIESGSSQTEILQLIQSFNKMSDSIRKNIELEKDMAVSHERSKKEKLETIGLLSSSLSHNLRNPLAAIKGVSELLQHSLGDKLTDTEKHRFAIMNDSISNMVDQIEGVLAFVQNKPLNIELHSLKKILESTCEKISVPPDVSIKLPEDNIKIHCDFQKIEVVFSNLLLNAIHAVGNKGQIIVRNKTKNDQVIIEIEDSGSGIDADVLPKIFDPLFTTKNFGTGLGLAACKGIIEQHGGTISVKNNPTTFMIHMPSELDAEQLVDKNRTMR